MASGGLALALGTHMEMRKEQPKHCQSPWEEYGAGKEWLAAGEV